MKTEIIDGVPVRIWDNGGKTLDRYTVLYTKHGHKGLSEGRGMSINPRSPNGFGQWCEAKAGPHLGRRITFSELPSECQRCVYEDIKTIKEEA